MLRKLLHLLFHFWREADDNGKTVYEFCSFCPARRTWHRVGGYQPTNPNWERRGK